MYGFIYLTTNKINGKKYIGMCKNTHHKGYFGSGKLLKQAIKKYGKENFERTILEKCETFEELSESESYWIKFYNAVESFEFYNLADGGFGGNSDYLKKYWSSLNKEERKFARNWSRRNMVNTNNPMWGRKHSEETKSLIGSKSVNRNWHNPNHFGSNNPNAKKVLVEIKSTKTYYDCLKDFCDENKTIPYSTLKGIAKDGRFSKKYGVKITYV
jgi:group I intron endonuclease|tara:strand:+ start:268 stop:909 length:642 start_codon:yes stop_codon:yes gene_type:complete